MIRSPPVSRKMQMHTCAISEESSTFELNGARLIVVLNGRFSFLNIRNATRGGVFCRMARLISAQSCPPASASSRSVRSRASPDSHLRTSSVGTLQEHPCTSQHLPPPPFLVTASLVLRLSRACLGKRSFSRSTCHCKKRLCRTCRGFAGLQRRWRWGWRRRRWNVRLRHRKLDDQLLPSSRAAAVTTIATLERSGGSTTSSSLRAVLGRR